MAQKEKVSRRKALRNAALVGSTLATGSVSAAPEVNTADFRQELDRRVTKTPFIDTHEHLMEEEDRLKGSSPRIKANDWSLLLSHYLDSDLRSAGMPKETFDAFFSAATDPLKKWDLIEPYWPLVRHTGYGQAVEIAMRTLYDVPSLGRDTIARIQAGYQQRIRPGFYQEILGAIAGIESCQVNSLSAPFSESKQPLLLMQDISILGMHMGPDIKGYAPLTGIEVKELEDWHAVIDAWFQKYATYAVAVKTQAAYARNIDFEDVPAETAAPLFRTLRNNGTITRQERKQLEDHLFWYAVRRATAHRLPVKLHTGYYAGHSSMPLSRLQGNPGAAADLCRKSPETNFVFMHIGYPYYEEMIALAKQWVNAYIDMCWAWIISPVASTNFLAQFLVTAPANKVLTFGGDYLPVEPVVGHAAIARRGIINSLTRLVEEKWLTAEAALDLVEPIMRGNAYRLFRLDEKIKALKTAPWMEKR